MDYLLPFYTAETGNQVKVITGGTGFVLQQLARGDIEIAITHQPQLEEALLAKFPEGSRHPFMYNHFILIGPQNDPAHAAAAVSFQDALHRIYDHNNLFISRGDNSGSHVFELTLWDALNVSSAKRKQPWYLEVGQDMGPTIQIAGAKNAYMITDQGTWFAYRNQSPLRLIYEGMTDGMNIYSVIQLKDTQHLPKAAAQFVHWILQKDTQKKINDFTINGQQGFFTNDI
jgi:tungstate transport system substrate-binding protein